MTGSLEPDRSNGKPAALAKFPRGAVWAVSGLILTHLALVWLGTARLVAAGALDTARVATEPWRLVTSIFLHADTAHVFWNGVSMLVFAVPLIGALGRARTALIYLAAGVCGGLAAWIGAPGLRVVIGSSGAVAGLFGAWLALTWQHVRHVRLPRRARLRVVGIGLLILPALLSPTTPSGRSISVASHVGGLLAGLLAGAVAGRVAAAALFDDDSIDQADGGVAE